MFMLFFFPDHYPIVFSVRRGPLGGWRGAHPCRVLVAYDVRVLDDVLEEDLYVWQFPWPATKLISGLGL